MTYNAIVSNSEVAEGLANEWVRGISGFEDASIAFSCSGSSDKAAERCSLACSSIAGHHANAFALLSFAGGLFVQAATEFADADAVAAGYMPPVELVLP